MKHFTPCFCGNEAKKSVSSNISAPDFPPWFIYTVSVNVDNLINIVNCMIVLRVKKKKKEQPTITSEIPSW